MYKKAPLACNVRSAELVFYCFEFVLTYIT